MTEPKQHISPSVLRQKADNGRTIMLSPQVLRELADYIEWMQQRIAELEGYTSCTAISVCPHTMPSGHAAV